MIALFINVNPTNLPFGPIQVGTHKDGIVRISNYGVNDLIIDQIGLDSGFEYFVYNGNSGYTISSGQYEDVSVTFSPEEVGYFVDNLKMESNDPDDVIVIVSLSGSGVLGDVYGCTDVNALNYDPGAEFPCDDDSHGCGGENCCCEYGFIDLTNGDVSFTFENGDGVEAYAADIRTAAASFINHLGLSSEGTWMGLVGFNRYANILTGNLGYDSEFLQNYVSTMGFGDSSTDFHTNLGGAMSTDYCLFSNGGSECSWQSYGDRDDAIHPDYAVVVMSNDPDCNTQDDDLCNCNDLNDIDMNCACYAANYLKNSGVKIITIAVGNNVDYEFLRDRIASPSTQDEIYAYRVGSYESLPYFFNKFFG
jgi:hypothetical protein